LEKIKHPYMESYRNLFQRQKNERNPKNDIIGGIICLVIGIILFSIGQSRMDAALALVNSDYAYYSPSAINEVYSQGFYLRLIGIFLLISGIVGLVYGFFRIQKQNNEKVAESVIKRFCPKCGREIPFDSIVCPYCQHDFK
jgi:uncharacterized membrane protein